MVPPCRRDPPDAGPARCGKSSRVCPFDGGYDPFGSGEADGTAEEAEFADNDSHRAAADAAFAGENRFAHTGLCPGGREFLMGPGSGSTTLRCPEVLYLVGGFTRGEWAGRR